MSFKVFPDPPTAPLQLNPGVTSGAFTLPPTPPLASGITSFFIRIAMLGAVPAAPSSYPSILLKANTGTETLVTSANDSQHPQPIPDGVNIEVADAIWSGPDANNLHLVQIFIFSPAPAINWQMKITNNDPAAGGREFTFVVADTDTESRQPWIDVTLPPGGVTNFDVLINQTGDFRQIMTVNNYGTGDLTISNIIGPIAGSGGFALAEAPGTIGPNSSSGPAPGSGDLTVTFTPQAATGTSNLTLSLTTNDAGALTAPKHNKQLSFTATTRRLEVGLMLDASGSMAYMPNGSPTVLNPNESRWGRLKLSVKEFLVLLGSLGAGQGRFAVGMFPDITNIENIPCPVPSPSANDFQAPADILPATISAATAALDNHTPKQNCGATPIGFGIARAIGTTASGFGYFLGPDTPTDKPVSLNKRFLVLMSDGAHNSGPPNPPDFYGDDPTDFPSFKDKKIKAITIAYGDPAVTAFEVDHQLLADISKASADTPAEATSLTLDAGADDAGALLKKQFRDVLKTGLSLDPFTDPGGILTENEPEASHQVTVTPFDTKVAFVVDWKTPDAERVSVVLVTPNCELITPQAAKKDKNIDYFADLTYAIYVVDRDYLRNAKDPANPRYGAWKLIVTGHFPPIIEIATAGADSEGFFQSEPYTFEVITESRLKLRLSTEQGTHFAGDEIKLTAALTADGRGISHASVTAVVTAPGQGAINFLAKNAVTAEEFAAAAERFRNEDVTAIGIKSFALRTKGTIFDPATQLRTIRTTDSENQGLYTATFGNTATPGTYEFYVTAIGQTADGITFRREKRLQVRVEVRPEPQFTVFDIIYRQIIEGEQTINVADVRVLPRDRFGNVILVDTAIDPRVALTVRGGEFIGPLVSNLDGNYIRSVRFNPGATPAVGLDVGGVSIVRPQPLTPVDRLHYVDRVAAFKLGGEAEKGANKHTDPNAALGDIRQKRPDEFVSLGAFGSLAVEIKRHVIEAQGDDDVTVFVRPDDTLRSYLVEALPVSKPSHEKSYGRKKTWVALGTSPGVTQSFSLSSAGIKRAAAIRITDQSGRTRDVNFKPSSSPGVSILGVGAKKIRRGERHKEEPGGKKKGGDRDYPHGKPGGERRGGQPKGAKPGAKQKTPKSAKLRSKK